MERRQVRNVRQRIGTCKNRCSIPSASWDRPFPRPLRYFSGLPDERERPNLKAYLIEKNFYNGIQRELRFLRMELTLIVANHSTLPNAVIGAKVWIGLKDGTLKEADHLQFDPTTPQPFNIGSLQTVKLKLNGALGFVSTEELEIGACLAT